MKQPAYNHETQINNPLPFAQFTALQKYNSAEEGICIAHKHGYSHSYIDFSLKTESLDQWNKKRIDNLKNIIEKFQVKPIFHGNFKAPLASDLEDLRIAAIQYIKKEIQIASHFSAPLIIHAGGIVEPRLVKLVKKHALEKFLLSLHELVPYAKSLGVELWVENLSNYTKNHPFYYIFTSPHEFEYIFSQCNDIKFFLDIGHANIGNTDVNGIIRDFHHRIVGISISNNNGVQDQHVNIFNGTVNYRNIISTLLDLNWKGYIGVEVRDTTPSDSLLHLENIYKDITKK